VKTADIFSNAVVVLFGLALLFVFIPGFVPVESGPGFGLAATTMPNVAVTTMVALAAMFFVYRLCRAQPTEDSEAEYDSTPPIEHNNWVFLLRGGVFLIAVTAIFEWVGFLAAGPPTVAGFMIIMDEKRPIAVIGTSIVATAVIWLFFWQFLRFPLP
jgi:hypothetical protein